MVLESLVQLQLIVDVENIVLRIPETLIVVHVGQLNALHLQSSRIVLFAKPILISMISKYTNLRMYLYFFMNFNWKVCIMICYFKRFNCVNGLCMPNTSIMEKAFEVKKEKQAG